MLFQGGKTFSDSVLMPAVSGASGAQIVFGSYGTGQATISQGVWFVSKNYLTFDNLALGPQGGLQGGNTSGSIANNITVQRCTIDFGSGAAGNTSVGINATGNNWTIASNVVRNVGNSGMLLQGDNYTISANTIDRTGLDSAIGYGMHGIYLKVSNASVTNNTITNFANDGVSVRYRNSYLSGNKISGGPIGIAWFQYDTVAGTSRWTNNSITNTTDTGVYVSASDQAGATIESFVITGNTLTQPTGASGWQAFLLKPTAGSYTVSGNNVS